MPPGDCPDAPPEQFDIDFRFKRVLVSFSLAEHKQRFYCAPSIQCPMTGYAKPFSSRPPFDSKKAAFEHAVAEAVPFIEEHAKSAVKFFKVWRPAIPK